MKKIACGKYDPWDEQDTNPLATKECVYWNGDICVIRAEKGGKECPMPWRKA